MRAEKVVVVVVVVFEKEVEEVEWWQLSLSSLLLLLCEIGQFVGDAVVMVGRERMLKMMICVLLC